MPSLNFLTLIFGGISLIMSISFFLLIWICLLDALGVYFAEKVENKPSDLTYVSVILIGLAVGFEILAFATSHLKPILQFYMIIN